MLKKLLFTFLFSSLMVFSGLSESSEARLLRFPTINQDAIVFVYAGDLYKVPLEGGTARKLTSHEGYEAFPRFSPDGETIAFTGQYDGNREVYTIPADGGQPQRVTYSANLNRDYIWERMGPNNIVMGWKGNDSILYRSKWRHFVPFKGDLKLTPADGGMPRTLQLSSGGFASYSPENHQLAFNHIFREFRNWKHYKGGMANDVHIMDLATKSIRSITDNPAQDIIPMWRDSTVYFLSDRNWRMNLYGYNLASDKLRQLTHFQDFDIKFPSMGGQYIVFEKGGYLYVYDTEGDGLRKVDVQIKDDQISGKTKRVDASKFKGNHHLAPDGSRVTFTGRGDIFSLPTKAGVTYNFTESSGVHERNVRWSPDGEHLAYISDKTGEDEIYVMPADGSGSPTQLTENGDVYKYHLRWSPDSKKILWANRKMKLQYVSIEDQTVTEVDSSDQWEIRDYRWSPDSRWVVYSKPEKTQERTIYTYSLENDETRSITRGWYPAYQPHFSQDGRYLFFISKRTFNPIYSETEWNHAYKNMAKLYLVPLTKETKSPFEEKNAEVNIDKGDGEKDKSKESSNNDNVRIDFANIQDRIAAFPVEASNYGELTPVNKRLFYVEKSLGDKRATLKAFNLEKEKQQTIGHTGNYQISANGEKMLFKKGGHYYISGLPKKKLKTSNKVSLSVMDVRVNLQKEWQQIFDESWRQMRDFFYDPDMHGFDWQAIRSKFEPLVDHVNHRADLTYVISEMMASLNVGHAYVGGGDLPEVKQVKTGLLGARFSKDESGYFRIDKVMEGANWDKGNRSPLTQVGVEVTKGDFILSVNGKSLKDIPNIYQALTGKAGETVELRVNNKPTLQDSRSVVLKPLASEKSLYYHEWVQNNIDYVDSATNGRVGYVHIPDMARNGLNEFMENFYPQLRKDALIVDIRGNGGGNVSPMLIERLRRKLVMHKVPRNGEPRPDPSDQIIGPQVCMLDQWTASDGDLFAYRFREHDLGPLIGQRSWGGVVGIRGSLPFVDGFKLYKPEFAKFDKSGDEWIIEGHGIEPDIPVYNDPNQYHKGHDQQLDRSIKEIMDLLSNDKPALPDPPPYPDKSKSSE